MNFPTGDRLVDVIRELTQTPEGQQRTTAGLIAFLHERMVTAEASRDRCQAENTRYVERIRELQAALEAAKR